LCKGYLFAQLSPPDLRCISVIGSNSVTLTWNIPPDPTAIFTSYQIWTSPFALTGYTLAGTVNVYGQNTFVHTPANGNAQSQYYYIKTLSSAGTNTSIPSDTLRSIFVNISGASVNGVASLNWNAIHTPSLSSTASTYTVSREFPAGVWTTIYNGTKQSYKDTIYRCKVFYNYKVEVSDASGCISQSNINGDTCKNIQPPIIPILDTVSINNSGQIVMGWPQSPSTDVTCFVVYKSSGGFLTAIDTLCGNGNTTFVVPGSSPNTASECYCIAAKDSCGNYSIPSITHCSIFLNDPTYDVCSRTSNLTWQSYNNLPNGVLRYDVYCSVNGGAYTLIGSSTTTNFSHSGLVPNANYCYFVRVWNTNQNISARSNQKCFTATGLPAPAYVYINSVSVNPSSKNIELTFTVDNANTYKGSNIYKSEDGINYKKIDFVASSATNPIIYNDANVKTSSQNYFYKIQIADDCDNPGVWSDSSKSILLHVKNNEEDKFNNTLTWDDYLLWNAGVESYNIYRAVDGVFDSSPIANVPLTTKTYVDNVQNFIPNQGKFSYYIEAIEANGNIYGFKDKATSNAADAYVEADIFVPNAFAPKGLNKVWLPVTQYVEKTDYKVMVFNRWGTKVFETTSDTEGWTGEGATDEVYVYIIEYKNARGEFIQLKGHLTLVR
jgi:hypothetical protein